MGRPFLGDGLHGGPGTADLVLSVIRRNTPFRWW